MADGSVALRDVTGSDLPIFFEQQLDLAANQMAAFTVKDPTDGEAHTARWNRLLSDETVRTQAILLNGCVAGHVASFDRDGKREVTYWVGSEFWGQGVARRALAEFLHQETTRPLFARVAKDNAASVRVLEKCEFAICGEDKGFANARREEVEEFIVILTRAD